MNNNENEKQINAVVSEVQRQLYTVICEYGEVHAKLKGAFYKQSDMYPVVGDSVLLSYNPSGDSLIEKIFERKTMFSRTDFSGHAAGYVKTIKEQVMAANFDYVFILDSLNKNFNANRITRYVSITLKSGAKPIVVLTKADVCDNVSNYVEKVKSISDKIEVCVISAKLGTGMDKIKSYLTSGTTIVFLGSSGVGKSTLVNSIAGFEVMKVSEIRESDSKGRHTTTHRQMIVLPSGVSIIDTPGIRELGLYDAKDGIDDTFSDIVELFFKCKYSNCKHNSEPGCAIKKAIEDNVITKERWKLYCQLRGENNWAKSKTIKMQVQRDKINKSKNKN